MARLDDLFIAALPVGTPASQPATEGEPAANEGNAQTLTLPSSMLSVLTLMDSDDVDTALETLLYGPHEIGAENDGDGPIPCSGTDFLIADRETALVLERDRSHYGLREEVTTENGGAFIACTDHFVAADSYEENGEASDQPMSAYGLPGQDIIAGDITLPIANLIESLSDSEKKELNDIFDNDIDGGGLAKIKQIFAESKAFAQTRQSAVDYTQNAKIKKDTEIWIFTSKFISQDEKASRFIDELEQKGIKIFTDTCMVVSPVISVKFKNILTNSAKAAFYLTRDGTMNVNLLSLNEIMESVIQ